jgi:hypothetical protein
MVIQGHSAASNKKLNHQTCTVSAGRRTGHSHPVACCVSAGRTVSGPKAAAPAHPGQTRLPRAAGGGGGGRTHTRPPSAPRPPPDHRRASFKLGRRRVAPPCGGKQSVTLCGGVDDGVVRGKYAERKVGRAGRIRDRPRVPQLDARALGGAHRFKLGNQLSELLWRCDAERAEAAELCVGPRAGRPIGPRRASQPHSPKNVISYIKC